MRHDKPLLIGLQVYQIITKLLLVVTHERQGSKCMHTPFAMSLIEQYTGLGNKHHNVLVFKHPLQLSLNNIDPNIGETSIGLPTRCEPVY